MASEAEKAAARKIIRDQIHSVLDFGSSAVGYRLMAGVDDIADAMLEAAERARWQPIETAPKDGTIILLADYRYPHRPEISSGFWENRNWTDGSLELSPLTHWQPLPSPPESSK